MQQAIRNTSPLRRLGEGCSHIAAVMFKVECAVRLGHTSVTAQSCWWNETFCKKVSITPQFFHMSYHYYNLPQIGPSLISDIVFRRPKRGRDINVALDRPNKRINIRSPSSDAQAMFIDRLKGIHPTSVVLSAVEIHEQPSVQPVVRKLPASLVSLQNSKYSNLSAVELREACQHTFDHTLTISSEEAAYLEESTRLQSQSPLWFHHRVGRITASNFKRVKQTSISNPSSSLIKKLMQETKVDSSKVPALHWGIMNEDKARKEYLDFVKEHHNKLEYFDSGLHVNPSFPHLGATPDGVITCDCCGKGLIEIKCPYKYRNKHPHDLSDPSFYVQKDKDGEFHLCENHEYYYQVQGQLAVCGMEYCDFICWTPCGMHYERILSDPVFFDNLKPILDNFFVSVLLPRLLTGSSSTVEKPAATKMLAPNTYCWCGGEDEGSMVACDCTTCPRQWFHFKCVGLTRKPRGKWFCSDNCKLNTV